MTTDIAARITDLLEPEAIAHGFELVAVEQSGGRGTPVIRVLLDREDGIDIEALSSANSWVNDVLDAADPVGGPYTLEISSPGVDRPLVKRADFERFAGETVNVKAQRGEKRRSWTGTLVGMDGDDVVLDVDGERVLIAYDNVFKARLKGAVDFGKGRGAV